MAPTTNRESRSRLFPSPIGRIMLSVLFISILQLGIAQVDTSGYHTVLMTLEDTPFTSVRLFEHSGDRRLLIDGEQVAKDTWKFDIADSLVWNSNAIKLHVRDHNTENPRRIAILFTPDKSSSSATDQIDIEDRLTRIHARYSHQTVDKNMDVVVRTSDNRDSVYSTDFTTLYFELLPDKIADHSNLLVRIKAPHYSWFSDPDKTYDEQLQEYLHLTEAYPDSRYLMSRLATNLTRYKSREDIARVYALFSDKHQNSYWAQIIREYLSGTFENMDLPELYSGRLQPIVRDTSKYNLIVFSASWCAPCIREIPQLQKIHEDLGKKLEITYITIDRKADIPAFERLLAEHRITWRTLLAPEDATAIRHRFGVSSIPHNILVSPHGDMNTIDIRQPDDMARLYQLMGVPLVATQTDGI